jgi:hypothetical protein
MKAGIAAQKAMMTISRAVLDLACFYGSGAQRLRGKYSASATSVNVHSVCDQSATPIQSTMSVISHTIARQHNV